MQSAGRTLFGRHGDIHLLRLIAHRKLLLVHFAPDFLISLLRIVLKLIDHLAHGRTLLLRNAAQLLHQAGDAALFAQIALPELIKLTF